jgi:hypothetical protein
MPAKTKQISIIQDAVRSVLRRAMGTKQSRKTQSVRENISGTGYIASMWIPAAKAITEIKNKLPACLSDKT